MLKALPYAVAALVAIAVIVQGANALYSYVYKSGKTSCELAVKQNENIALAKTAQHIIDEQAKLQIIEDAIRGDKDNSKISNPVLIRTFDSVSKCSGKTNC